MTANGYAQAVNLIQKSESVALALPEKPTADDAASLLAAGRVLGRLNKKVGLVFSGQWPEPVTGLFSVDEFIPGESGALKNFIIAVNQAGSPIKELRYERSGDTLNIILASDERPIRKEDISLKSGPGQYDLLIVFGAPRLEDLGKTFEEEPALFYDKPIIAIAASAGNEAYGEVNLIDPAKSSAAEITAELIRALAPDELDELSATALMLGLIAQTNNFQNGRTKPSALGIASELMDRGARKDEIVRLLHKTKPLSLLQLWGRASVRSRLDTENRILWTVLTGDDFVKTGTRPEEALPFALSRFEEHFALPERFVLLWQAPGEGMVRALCKNPLPESIKNLFSPSRLKSGYLEFQKQFASFPEAEKAMDKILRQDSE